MAYARSFQERGLGRARAEAAQRERLQSHLATDTMLRANYTSDSRVEAKRRAREAAEAAAANEAADTFVRGQARRDRALREAQQEQALAHAIERRKNDTLRDQKMRQLIREESEELRALEARLKAAYVNKERASQITEKQLRVQQAMAVEAAEDEELRRQWQRSFVDEDARQAENAQRKHEYRTALEDQMDAQELAKQAAYEEFLREKRAIDAVVARIEEEETAAEIARLEKQRETKEYIDNFMEVREAKKAAERARLEEEDRRIAEHVQVTSDRQAEVQRKKREEADARERIFERQFAAMEREQMRQEEYNRLRDELHWEEEAARRRQEERAEMEARIRSKLELQRSYDEQLRLKALRAEQQQAQEAAFREEMLAKFAEDDRLEQMNAQKRRMKQAAHRREVERLVEERRAAYEAEVEAEAARRAQEDAFEDYRRKIIEEERQRLIQEHAENLIGFLPPGVLRDEADLDLLPSNVRNAIVPSRGGPPETTSTARPSAASSTAPWATHDF